MLLLPVKVFLKTYDIGFDEIITTFMDQNHRPLEIEDKFDLTLRINKQKRYLFPQNQERENMSEDMNFCHF